MWGHDAKMEERQRSCIVGDGDGDGDGDVYGNAASTKPCHDLFEFTPSPPRGGSPIASAAALETGAPGRREALRRRVTNHRRRAALADRLATKTTVLRGLAAGRTDMLTIILIDLD